MEYLVYASQAAVPPDAEDLSALLSYSRLRNLQEGITGMLIYRFVPEAGRGTFMQLLEGPRPALDAVWQRISSDRRHHSIVVIEEGTAPERTFPDWSMGFRNVDEAALSGIEGFADLGSDAFWDRVNFRVPTGGLRLLRSFYEPV
ncbi:BLUF domain-containing protein [Salipiger sp. 1_MG-2023]|uniref:BLUF domain-containing protein n=1 Tax=Salipiger sp. 1_MG-2023 TaxID=3062665 RepID=UPI0026E3E047|nr:BLUF domain-containing protein [Salipiger sp. 1_MG-2023]MDO6586454.1 BLUF domain-containing protein [Salipiger sp. 1_MG-2023]